MKPINLFLTLNLLLCVQVINAQELISTSVKARQLLLSLKKEHLKAPPFDDSFGKSVHDKLLDFIDGDSIFISIEDRLKLEEESKSLGSDIEAGDIKYFMEVKNMYTSRVEASKTLIYQYIDQKDLLDPQNVAGSDNSKIDPYKQQLKAAIRQSVISNLLRDLEADKYEYPKDSLEVKLKNARLSVKHRYEEFFKNVETINDRFEAYYLNAIALSFDPHTLYLSKESAKEFEEELASERELFGITYTKDIEGRILITQLLPGSSAWMSGEIHLDDELLSLRFGDGEKIELANMTQYQVSQLFNDATSKELELTLKGQNGEIKVVTLHKSKVYSDSDVIKSAILNGSKKVAYISLPDFYMNWTDTSNLGCANDLAKVLIKMKNENVNGVILDLRDNGGGSLKEAIDLTGIFIDYGPVLVEKDHRGEISSMKDFNRGAVYNGPLMVLVNEYSASASEVVAGALQDYNRALVVGRQSFGKATGQVVIPLDPQYGYGTNSWMAPNEEWGFVNVTDFGLYRIDLSTNQKRGVLPDIELKSVSYSVSEKESDYRNAIELDSISKKVYYTKYPEINKNVLKQESEKRQNEDEVINKYLSLYDRYNKLKDELEKDFDKLSLTSIIEKNKELDKIFEEYELTEENFHAKFTAESLTYDKEVYKMNTYLNEYQNNFLERVSKDHELDEAYQIMLNYLGE